MLRRRFPNDPVRGEWTLRVAASACAGAALTVLAIISGTQAAQASPSVKSIVAREHPMDTLAGFFAAIDASSGDSGSFFRSVFGGTQAITVPKKSVAGDQPESSVRIVMAGEVDPRFEQWQKHADERLKQEKANTVLKQHPLALANPDKSVVVCEAGCRTTKDEIVYIAAVVPAVLPVASTGGEFEPNSSNAAPDPAAAGLEEGELPCIAGCYDPPKRKSAPARRTTEHREPPARPAKAERRIAVAKAQPVTPPPVRVAALAPVEHASAGAQSAIIAARIRSRLQVGHNGAIIEQPQTESTRLAKVEQAPSARQTSLINQSWRTTIVFAHGHEPKRTSVAGELHQSRHERHAYAQTRIAWRD